MMSLRVHNVLDYVLGAFLLVAPWVFNFSELDAARDVMLFGGATLIVYSLLTNYHYAIARLIPLGAHMTLDALLGVFLILGPVLFGYRGLITEGQYAAHIVLGLIAVGMVAVTQPRSEAAKTPAERAAISSHDEPIRH
jgi:hypothetical protein